MSNCAENRTTRPVDDDLPFVTAAQEGDLGAFETLVLKYQRRMLNIAFRIIGDQEDAVEVVQDVFVSVYRNLAGFRREAKFTTWLTAITVNLSKNRLQQVRTRNARTPVSLDAPFQTGDGELLPDPPSREPSVLDRLESKDVTSKVQECIQALEPEFREVIVLRDLQDRPMRRSARRSSSPSVRSSPGCSAPGNP